VLPGNSQFLKELLLKQTAAWHDYARLAHLEPE
jgi:hypothetical protein